MKLEIELNHQDRGIRFKNNLFIKKKDIDILNLLSKKGKLDQLKILYPTYKHKKQVLPKINKSKSQESMYFLDKLPYSLNLQCFNNKKLKLISPIAKTKKVNYRQVLFHNLSSVSSYKNSLVNTPLNQHKKNHSLNYSYNFNSVIGNNNLTNRNNNNLIVTNYTNRKCIYGNWNGVLTRNKDNLNHSNNEQHESGVYGDNISVVNEDHNYSQSIFDTNNVSCCSNKFKSSINKEYYLKPVNKFNK